MVCVHVSVVYVCLLVIEFASTLISLLFSFIMIAINYCTRSILQLVSISEHVSKISFSSELYACILFLCTYTCMYICVCCVCDMCVICGASISHRIC